MSIIPKRAHHIRDVSMQNCVLHNLIAELVKLRLGWQLTVDQQEGHLKEAGLFSRDPDRVSAGSSRIPLSPSI